MGKNTRVGKRKFIRSTIKRGNSVTCAKELASCYGKIRHTKREASERAKAVTNMKAYKCKFCPHYHVGRAIR